MKRVILLVVFLLGFGLVLFAQQQITTWPPPNDGQTHLTYDAAHAAYHLTRTDGTFGTVLFFDNSAEPGYPTQHDYSLDAVNVDGQHSIGTYHWNGTTYIVSSLLDLDQDGHFSVGGGNGRGISTDSNTGDTCIPYNATIIGACNVPTSLHIAQNGTLTPYLGLATAGHGISPTAKTVDGTATGTVTNYLVWTTPPPSETT